MTNTEQNNSYLEAQKRVKKIKGFYVHLVVFITVNLFLFVLSNIYNRGKISYNDINFINWTFSNLGLWGLGLVIHGLTVFTPNLFLGKQWEERKIKELMEKENQQKQKWS